MYIHSVHSVIPAVRENDSHLSGEYLKMEDQDFSDLFEKNELRRLTKLIRNGIGCGLRALNKSESTRFDAVITGSGKGSISKIEQFLFDIDAYKETALNPGVFVQSTHNTINGQLALKTGCSTYNMTHVNQGLSLHNVLKDAEIFLAEYPDANILAGVFEENTDFNIDIHEKAGLCGQLVNGHFSIMWGEGVTFFMISNHRNNPSVKINKTVCFTDLDDIDHWTKMYQYLYESPMHHVKTAFLLGYNNDDEKLGHYAPLVYNLTAESIPYYNFKQRTGEHDTAAGYAIDLANQILTDRSIAREFFGNREITKVIIINHFKDYVCHLMEFESEA